MVQLGTHIQVEFPSRRGGDVPADLCRLPEHRPLCDDAVSGGVAAKGEQRLEAVDKARQLQEEDEEEEGDDGGPDHGNPLPLCHPSLCVVVKWEEQQQQRGSQRETKFPGIE